MSYVKANQTGIVLFVIASYLFTPWILAALWLIQIVGLLTSGRYNLFVRLAKPFLHPQGKETQAAELTRFNNSLAVIFLTLALLSLSLGWTAACYAFASMLLAAAGAALLGYCVGCTIYFQFKQFKARRSH
jgi:cobalamin synthase